jgi:hypothetical protein
MDSQLKRGERVVRLASEWPYVVPVGTEGLITHVYETALDQTAFDVLWDGREVPVFAAGSRLRSLEVAADHNDRSFEGEAVAAAGSL